MHGWEVVAGFLPGGGGICARGGEPGAGGWRRASAWSARRRPRTDPLPLPRAAYTGGPHLSRAIRVVCGRPGGVLEGCTQHPHASCRARGQPQLVIRLPGLFDHLPSRSPHHILALSGSDRERPLLDRPRLAAGLFSAIGPAWPAASRLYRYLPAGNPPPRHPTTWAKSARARTSTARHGKQLSRGQAHRLQVTGPPHDLVALANSWRAGQTTPGGGRLTAG